MVKKRRVESPEVYEDKVINDEVLPEPFDNDAYEVKEGDTLRSISFLFDIGVEKLKVINGITNIKPGDRIKVR